MSLSNRIATLKRKASQLSSLCDVSVCLIGFTPDGTLFTWPDRHADAVSTLHYYKQTVANNSTKRPFKKMKPMDQDDGHQHTNVNAFGYGCGPSSSSSIMNCSRQDELVRLMNDLDCRLERIRASFHQQKTQSQFVGGEAMEFDQYFQSGSESEFEDLIAATTQPHWTELGDDVFIVPCDFITCHDDDDLDSILFY